MKRVTPPLHPAPTPPLEDRQPTPPPAPLSIGGGVSDLAPDPAPTRKAAGR
jgi:hypothetical protein